MWVAARWPVRGAGWAQEGRRLTTHTARAASRRLAPAFLVGAIPCPRAPLARPAAAASSARAYHGVALLRPAAHGPILAFRRVPAIRGRQHRSGRRRPARSGMRRLRADVHGLAPAQRVHGSCCARTAPGSAEGRRRRVGCDGGGRAGLCWQCRDMSRLTARGPGPWRHLSCPRPAIPATGSLPRPLTPSPARRGRPLGATAWATTSAGPLPPLSRVPRLTRGARRTSKRRKRRAGRPACCREGLGRRSARRSREAQRRAAPWPRRGS